MTAESKSLHELFPADWPAAGPQRLLALWYADASTLTPLQLELRAMCTELVHGADEVPITDPEVVLNLLLPARSKKEQVGRLRVLDGTWATYVLDGERKRVLRRNKHGWNYLKVESALVPDPDKLPPLPPGGRYVLLWGGGPSVLSKPGVARRLRNLFDTTAQAYGGRAVADALFWDRSGSTPTLFSLSKGCGDQGGTEVPFPDQKALQEASP